MTPERLLFTDRAGHPCQLQDVIYDGLDQDYSDRVPALIALMDRGEAAHRLYACTMLASWGVPEGLRSLIGWARSPADAPWAGDPVTFDRFHGADAAFEMLADAVRVAGDATAAAATGALRLEAGRALLAIYDRVHFGRSLALLFELDSALAAGAAQGMAEAVDRAIAAARTPPPDFDLPTQAAFLIGPWRPRTMPGPPAPPAG